MGAIAISIIKFGTISFIAQKALKSLGKNDYADIISICGWLGISVEVYNLLMLFVTAINNSKLFNLFSKLLELLGL